MTYEELVEKGFIGRPYTLSNGPMGRCSGCVTRLGAHEESAESSRRFAYDWPTRTHLISASIRCQTQNKSETERTACYVNGPVLSFISSFQIFSMLSSDLLFLIFIISFLVFFSRSIYAIIKDPAAMKEVIIIKNKTRINRDMAGQRDV